MALESLGDLLRACGQNPTLAEIAELEKGVGGDCRFFSVPLLFYVLLGRLVQMRKYHGMEGASGL